MQLDSFSLKMAQYTRVGGYGGMSGHERNDFENELRRVSADKIERSAKSIAQREIINITVGPGIELKDIDNGQYAEELYRSVGDVYTRFSNINWDKVMKDTTISATEGLIFSDSKNAKGKFIESAIEGVKGGVKSAGGQFMENPYHNAFDYDYSPFGADGNTKPSVTPDFNNWGEAQNWWS